MCYDCKNQFFDTYGMYQKIEFILYSFKSIYILFKIIQ